MKITEHKLVDDTVVLPDGATIIDIIKRGHQFYVIVQGDPGASLTGRTIQRVDVGETVPDNVTLVGRCYPHYFYEV